MARRSPHSLHHRERLFGQHAPDALRGVLRAALRQREQAPGVPVRRIGHGVNTSRFEEGGWSVDRAFFVNLFSNCSWTLSNVVGVLVGSAVGIPLAIASFAMTSIFICLLVTQKITIENVVAAAVAMVGVFACKAVGLTGPAILVGAIAGVLAAMLASRIRRSGRGERA